MIQPEFKRKFRWDNVCSLQGQENYIIMILNPYLIGKLLLIIIQFH